MPPAVIMEKQKLIAIAGPTASGKTALAVTVAKTLSGEVISNDSMQVYRGMEISTAAPTVEEMDGVPHHLIGILSPDEDFSCADYAALAKEKIKEVASRGKLPVMCGGTGLYLDSVLKVNDFSEGVKNEDLRLELSRYSEEHGAEALHKMLREFDPEAAEAIHMNNVRRVIRAIEIYKTTGITKTKWDRRSIEKAGEYDSLTVVLDFLSRELLYSRIDRRVDVMVSHGLLSEVEALFKGGYLENGKPAAQAIGCKEFIPYFAGEIGLEEALEEVKTASRRYAKRQITWFRRYKDALVIHPDREDGSLKSTDELLSEILRFFPDKGL